MGDRALRALERMASTGDQTAKSRLARARRRSCDPGLLTPRFEGTYHEAFERLFQVRDLVDPAHVAASFLAGLQHKRLDWRSILGSYGHFESRTVEDCVEWLLAGRSARRPGDSLRFDQADYEEERLRVSPGRYDNPLYARWVG